jgi:hypothetical protein
MVKVKDLLPQVEVLQQGGPPLPGPQGVLVVGHHYTLLGGQGRHPVIGPLMGLPACSPFGRRFRLLSACSVFLVRCRHFVFSCLVVLLGFPTHADPIATPVAPHEWLAERR